jgi:D-aminopeptidase
LRPTCKIQAASGCGVIPAHATFLVASPGVTAILPRGKQFTGRVFAARHNLNGNGEMTGASWLNESGCLGSPILLTNTHSVGVVRDAVIAWLLKRATGGGYSGDLSLPVVPETYVGFLNDINGFHVKSANATAAIEGASPGAGRSDERPSTW